MIFSEKKISMGNPNTKEFFMPSNQTAFDSIISQLQANTIVGALDLSNMGLTEEL